MPRGNIPHYNFTIREFINKKREGTGEFRIWYCASDEPKRKYINMRYGVRKTREEALQNILEKQAELRSKNRVQ